MANTVRSGIEIAPGAPWTFVHSSGKRTEYVYERQMAARHADPKTGYAKDAMHALLNPATGKEAQVSEKWMCEGPVGGQANGGAACCA